MEMVQPFPRQKQDEMRTINNIKGWDFRTERHFSADGGGSESTLNELREEVNKLENRLSEIPKLITQNKNLILQKRKESTWLKSLSRRKRRKWEKDNGKDALQLAYQMEQQAKNAEATIASLKTEQTRLPERIDAIKKQISTLVNAEGKGIEKGIDPESAKQLGEIEVAKQQAELQHQQQVRQKQAEAAQNEEDDKGSTTSIWITGGALVALIITIIIISRIRKAKLKTTAS